MCSGCCPAQDPTRAGTLSLRAEWALLLCRKPDRPPGSRSRSLGFSSSLLPGCCLQNAASSEGSGFSIPGTALQSRSRGNARRMVLGQHPDVCGEDPRHTHCRDLSHGPRVIPGLTVASPQASWALTCDCHLVVITRGPWGLVTGRVTRAGRSGSSWDVFFPPGPARPEPPWGWGSGLPCVECVPIRR